MQQERAQTYLIEMISSLQSQNETVVSSQLEKISQELSVKHYHEASSTLLQLLLSELTGPDTNHNHHHDDSGYNFIKENAFELHKNLIMAIRADISPIVYVKMIDLIAFSQLYVPSSTNTYFNNENYEKALALVESAHVSLAGQGNLQGRYAVQCIRSHLLLEHTMHDEAAVFAALAAHQAQQQQSNATSQAQHPSQTLVFQEAVRLLSAIPGSPPHQARKLLEDTEAFANSLQLHDVEAVLLYLLSKARGKDYELRRQYTLYYQNSFELLNYMKKAEMRLTAGEREQLAYKTILCAFLSDSIFNFGKFMQCEELQLALQNQKDNNNNQNQNQNQNRHNGQRAAYNMSWALQWMQQCSDGDVEAFERYFEANKPIIEDAIISFALGGGSSSNNNNNNTNNNIDSVVSETEAQKKEEIFNSISKKVRLMALLHLIFYTPIHKRVFTFAQIAERCHIRSAPKNNHHDHNHSSDENGEVELLLLTAMAQGIVRGKMDGLTQTVMLSWVEPRLLGRKEVRELAEHMRGWRAHAEGARADVHAAVEEVRAQQQAQA